MSHTKWNGLSILAAGLIATAVLTVHCGDDSAVPALLQQPLEAACIAPDGALPPGSWTCGEDIVVECDDGIGTNPETIWVDSSTYDDGEVLACEDEGLTINDEGPFGLGEHVILVSQWGDEDEFVLMCTSRLWVVDAEPPEVLAIETIELWPPNHRMVTVVPTDCIDVADRCDGDLDTIFTWATSDEADDGEGDGYTDNDIVLDPDRVEIRAERSGSGDGRVYTLGWLTVDDSGNHTTGTCEVVVPHDQGTHEMVSSAPQELVVLPEPVRVGPIEVLVVASSSTATVEVRHCNDSVEGGGDGLCD